LQEKNHFVDFYAKLLKNHPQISAKTQRNPGKKQWKLTIFSKTGKKP
jgi:predicted SnoaL-like aldol condensation-catalyzing enzyme